MFQTITEWFHEWRIKDRRVHILSQHIASLLQENCKILDVGCGDGKIAKSIKSIHPKIEIEGIDVLVREDCEILVTKFDGVNIPYPENYFDFILLIDVLHHTEHSNELLKECKRVAKKGIVIKDHLNNSIIDYWTLRFMDKVGNARYDVHLPHIYFSSQEWKDLIQQNSLEVEWTTSKLNLYPFPFNHIFDRKMHSLWHLIK
ncbi:class I SAM-dependent methyltransferase, partial [bacterium]